MRNPKKPKLICSGCGNTVSGNDGEFSKCCNEIILSEGEYNKAKSGKIPKVDPTFHTTLDNKNKKDKPKHNKVDMESGIRIGTIKYKVYKLWKDGLTIKETTMKLKANQSSVRSWFGRFERRYRNESDS